MEKTTQYEPNERQILLRTLHDAGVTHSEAECYILRHHDRLSVAEIAENTERKAPNVSNLLSSARRKLKLRPPMRCVDCSQLCVCRSANRESYRANTCINFRQR